jgi:CO/xanthine dehydrogenase FAD-binding subunit
VAGVADLALEDPMKPVRFEYIRAGTVADATDALATLGEEAAVLAGGLSLGPMLNLRLVRPRAVIDITRMRGPDPIVLQDGTLATAATLTQSDALDSHVVRREVPLLTRALPFVGHFQTRNRGTLGGSVAQADPSAEVPLCLTTLGGHVVLRSRRRERRVAARDFFLGALATARRPDELIVALEWPTAPPDAGHAFDEIAQRHGDFAIAAAACQLRFDEDGALTALALGLGGIEARPIVCPTAGYAGRPVTEALTQEIAEMALGSVSPMEDHVARADYRRALARVLIPRVIMAAAADARGRRGGPQ